MIKLSKTTKMPGRSWSLPAGSTCPGSFDKTTGEVIPVCKLCYAKSGNYTYPAVKNAREYNTQDWRRDDWVKEMINEISMESHFRWFDSGDLYHPELGRKILEVIKGTPDTKHWIPTRSHTIPRLRVILDEINEQPNAIARFSSPDIDGSYEAIHGSTVIPSEDWDTTAQVCPASKQDGKCRTCRACWDKTVPTIAYIGHGLAMSHAKKKLIKLKELEA